jgi:hypothetical protein
MSRFAKLADKPKEAIELRAIANEVINSSAPPPSRVGRKAISGYFSPEMSLALHTCARRNGVSLQALMAEAFDDVLRKYGESPIGG